MVVEKKRTMKLTMMKKKKITEFNICETKKKKKEIKNKKIKIEN